MHSLYCAGVLFHTGFGGQLLNLRLEENGVGLSQGVAKSVIFILMARRACHRQSVAVEGCTAWQWCCCARQGHPWIFLKCMTQ